MSEYIKTEYPKTRKEYSCHGCDEQIPKGTQTLTTTGSGDGEICTFRYCDICEKILDRFGHIIQEDEATGECEIAEHEDYADWMKTCYREDIKKLEDIINKNGLS